MHNLQRRAILRDLLLNDVLLRNELIMILHCSRQLQLSHFSQFRSITILIIDRAQLAQKGDSSRSATELRAFGQRIKYILHYTRKLRLSYLRQFRSTMIAKMDRPQFGQKMDSSRSAA